jgi:5-methylcytosine-specific restriction protein A
MGSKIDYGAAVAAEHGLARSHHWPSLEKWMKRYFGDACQICGKGPIQIHHWMPFHDCILAGRSELELTLENLTALCETEKDRPAEDHHVIAGHLCDFKSYNSNLLASIAAWKGLSGEAIKELNGWKLLAQAKPPSYPVMAPDVQAAFRATLDRILPTDQIAVWDGEKFMRNGAVFMPTRAA